MKWKIFFEGIKFVLETFSLRIFFSAQLTIIVKLCEFNNNIQLVYKVKWDVLQNLINDDENSNDECSDDEVSDDKNYGN